jgi:hypothetical protein
MLEGTLPVAQSMIQGIKIERYLAVKLKDGSELCPDAQFHYSANDNHGKQPSLVFEIANAQSKAHLIKKTKKLLTKINSHIRAAVGFDIQYDGNTPQDSTVSV